MCVYWIETESCSISLKKLAPNVVKEVIRNEVREEKFP